MPDGVPSEFRLLRLVVICAADHALSKHLHRLIAALAHRKDAQYLKVDMRIKAVGDAGEDIACDHGGRVTTKWTACVGYRLRFKSALLQQGKCHDKFILGNICRHPHFWVI